MLLANSHRFVIYPSAEELVWGTVALVFMLALVVVAFIAGRDMDRRMQAGWLWGLVVFLVPVLGLLMWLLVRRKMPVRARISAKG